MHERELRDLRAKVGEPVVELDARNDRTSSPAFAFVVAAVIGVTLWFAASTLAGRREAWDAPSYWIGAYPLAIGMAGVLGFVYPERPWRWTLVLFESQFVAMCVRNGELGGLWPLGLALFAIIALPAVVVAAAGSRLRSRLASRGSSSHP